MLHPFISDPVSHPDQRRRRRNPVLVSTALHALLLIVILAPSRPARYSTPPRGVRETVRYVTLPTPRRHPARFHASRRSPHAPRTSPAPRARRMPGPPRPAAFDLAFALTLVPSQPILPDVAMPTMVDTLGGDAVAASPFASSRTAADVRGTRGAKADSIAYIASEVDRGAAPAGVNPKPAYPAELLRRSVETSFSAYFVVDTTGRVDMTTVEIPTTVHPHFAQAVRDVLIRWHFMPAEVHGRRVRQLIEQTFRFVIVRGQFAQRTGPRATGPDPKVQYPLGEGE